MENKLEEFQVVSSLNDLGITPGQTENKTETPSADPIAERYFELLKEEELIYVPEDYKFDGTFGSLKQLQEQTYQYQYELAQRTLMEKMPEKLRLVVEAGLQGVDDIDSLLNVSKDKYFSATANTEDDQKKVIRQELSKTLTDDAIDDLIDSYIEKGKLKTEAERLLSRRQEEADKRVELMKKEAQIREQQERAEYEKFNAQLVTELKSQQWNTKKQEVIMRELTSTYQGAPLIQAKLNTILSDPKNLVYLAEFLSYYDGKQFDINQYKKIETNQMQSLQDKWASKLTDTPNHSQREHNRGNVDLSDFQIYVG